MPWSGGGSGMGHPGPVWGGCFVGTARRVLVLDAAHEALPGIGGCAAGMMG